MFQQKDNLAEGYKNKTNIYAVDKRLISDLGTHID